MDGPGEFHQCRSLSEKHDLHLIVVSLKDLRSLIASEELKGPRNSEVVPGPVRRVRTLFDVDRWRVAHKNEKLLDARNAIGLRRSKPESVTRWRPSCYGP